MFSVIFIMCLALPAIDLLDMRGWVLNHLVSLGLAERVQAPKLLKTSIDEWTETEEPCYSASEKNIHEHLREGNSIKNQLEKKNQLKSWYEMLIPH